MGKLKGLFSVRKWILWLSRKKISCVIPDKTFLQLKYWANIKRSLNLDAPRLYTEKLQWLKLFDRRPEYTGYVDKYAVRSFVKNTIGKEYVIPLYGVYTSFDAIDFSQLPDQFVLKPTHTSGNIYICTDKKDIDYKHLKKTVNQWLKREYYWIHREWPYKNISPKIICEKYLYDESGYSLPDYKFFCFNGQPKLVMVCCNRYGQDQLTLDFYDMEWNHLPVKKPTVDQAGPIHKRPTLFKDMFDIAKNLSAGIPHVRIDLYQDKSQKRIYFGEMTFFHWSGFTSFEPPEYDKLFGSWIALPKKKAPIKT